MKNKKVSGELWIINLPVCVRLPVKYFGSSCKLEPAKDVLIKGATNSPILNYYGTELPELMLNPSVKRIVER